MSPDKYRYPNNEGTLRAGIDGFLFGVATAVFLMIMAHEAGLQPRFFGGLILLLSVAVDVVVVWYSPSTPFGR